MGLGMIFNHYSISHDLPRVLVEECVDTYDGDSIRLRLRLFDTSLYGQTTPLVLCVREIINLTIDADPARDLGYPAHRVRRTLEVASDTHRCPMPVGARRLHWIKTLNAITPVLLAFTRHRGARFFQGNFLVCVEKNPGPGDPKDRKSVV